MRLKDMVNKDTVEIIKKLVYGLDYNTIYVVEFYRDSSVEVKEVKRVISNETNEIIYIEMWLEWIMKLASEIKKWGVIKPFFDKSYKFNSIDIETVDNELFIFGYILNDKYYYSESDFYDVFHHLLLESIRNKKDILTWSRYDNTHILKMLLSKIEDEKEIYKILRRVGKVSPIFTYKYKNFDITLEKIIKDSFIFKISDGKINLKE